MVSSLVAGSFSGITQKNDEEKLGGIRLSNWQAVTSRTAPASNPTHRSCQLSEHEEYRNMVCVFSYNSQATIHRYGATTQCVSIADLPICLLASNLTHDRGLGIGELVGQQGLLPKDADQLGYLGCIDAALEMPVDGMCVGHDALG